VTAWSSKPLYGELSELSLAQLDAKLERRLAGLRAELRQELVGPRSQVRTDLAALRRELVFEMFVLWVLNLVCTAGLLLPFRGH
jgi:hypothetical protein